MTGGHTKRKLIYLCVWRLIFQGQWDSGSMTRSAGCDFFFLFLTKNVFFIRNCQFIQTETFTRTGSILTKLSLGRHLRSRMKFLLKNRERERKYQADQDLNLLLHFLPGEWHHYWLFWVFPPSPLVPH